MSKSSLNIFGLPLVRGRLGLLAFGAILVALLVVQVSSPSASLHAQSGTAPAPTGLSAGSPTETTISLSWNAVTNAERYKVEYSTSSSGPWADAFYEVGVTSWTARALACGTTYYFRARTRGDGSSYTTEYGAASTGSVSETTSTCTTIANRADAPTGLHVTSKTETIVSLAWNAVPDAYRYMAQRSTSTSGPWTTVRFEYRLTYRNDDRGLDCGTTYYYRVRARGDGTPLSTHYGDPSSAITVTTLPCPPQESIAVSGLVSHMTVGDSDSFTVSASNLVSSSSYTIRLSTSGDDIGFNNSCSDRQEDITVPSGRTSYSTTVTLHGCHAPGETLSAFLRQGNTAVASATPEFVEVRPPITISGLVDTMQVGQGDQFTVSVTDLVSIRSYSIQVSTDDASIGFNSGCTQQVANVTVPSSRTQFSRTLTLYGCGTPGGTVTATLWQGSNRLTSTTEDVSVTSPPDTAFQFTPSPLALGGQSNVWTVPSGVTSVYVDVSFSEGSAKDGDAGDINVNRVSSGGTVLSTLAVDNENDSGVLTSATVGSMIRIDVDSDAFDFAAALVTLTFHSGSSSSGAVKARATVQKERRPYAPTNGSSSVDATADTVTLTWEPGALQLNANPDHYEVVIPNTSDSSNPLYVNRNVDDSSNPTTVTISNASGLGLTGTHTAEVRHCNAAGGCSQRLNITFTLPQAPTNTVFAFTPSPLALGGQSNVWTVPSGVTSVYVDVSFSEGSAKDGDAGDINVNRVSSGGTVLSTLAVDNENDSGVLTSATVGSMIRIDVDSDAFDFAAALVTLTFHSGSSSSGAVKARATVQKERRPYAPTNGSSSVDATADTVTLTWEPGALQLNANPDHYEVVIPNTSDSSNPLYVNRNVDDSSNPTTVTISNASGLGLTGTHTAEVRHCNAAGGCSQRLNITFTLPQAPTNTVFAFTPSPLALGGQSNVWTVPSGVTSVYVDVDFSVGNVKDSDAGDIKINRVSSGGTVLSTLAVDNENDSGVLTGAAAGSIIRIDVDNDAFDAGAALVTLTFHSGSSTSGAVNARATVQKERRPYSPTNGSASVDATADTVALMWGPGALQQNANPDHYEVVIPNTSDSSNPLYVNRNVSDSSDPTTLTISNASGLGLTGTHTAEVRHCNAAGGCSQRLNITFTLPQAPTNTVFAFTPSPLALGGTSNVWTVPSDVTSLYVDVDFSLGIYKDTDAGDININRVSSDGTVLSTLKEVDNENDSGVLTGVTAGTMIRIDVDNDAFDVTVALVTLTFHSGSSSSGAVKARATIQKEQRPYAPTNGSVVVDPIADTITLTWGPGAPRQYANPDHYEVVIPDTSNPSTPLYVNRNIDDSSNPTTLTISNSSTLGLTGTHTAEVRHCNAAGGCSSLALNITFTLPVRVQVNSENPFTGQSVMLTVSPPSSQGSVSSYQWQEWSNGQWTNLGTASTSTQYTARSTSAGVRAFRVVITYTSSVTENSSWVAVEWRPIIVTVTASPENPESGDATKRTVTLTATAEAPSGVSYQWQQGSDSTWTNLGTSSTTSTSKTVSFTTRGTRKFRVHVSHSTASSAVSEHIYVTWDEWAIVSDMVAALQSAVTGDATYTSAQTALVNCMNGDSGSSSGASGQSYMAQNATSTPPVGGGASGASGSSSTAPTAPHYGSFSDILGNYAGETKAKMDTGECSLQATTMFNRLKSLSRDKIAHVKSTSTEYAALLETPYGGQFEATVGESNIIKQFAHLLALQQSDAPSGGASGASSSVGLACLPNSGSEPSELQAKLNVLNCLVFDTPHSFWRNQADQLKQRIDSQYEWLGYGDWECTDPAPDGPVPSCKKHDVSYDSLQMFAGQAGAQSQDRELDEAWNPRNKALADSKFHNDILKYGCENPSFAARFSVCLLLSNEELAYVYHYAVAHLNNKGWPVTEEDIRHTQTTSRFVNCGDIPKILSASASQISDWSVRVNWQYESGNCVSATTVEHFSLCATGFYSGGQKAIRYRCNNRIAGDSRSSDLIPIFSIPFGETAADYPELRLLITLGIIPNDIIYGSAEYPPHHFDLRTPLR